MTKKNPLRHLRASDLRAAAQLATQATAGVVRIAEGVHQSVWQTLGAPGAMGAQGGRAAEQARGITGLVYRCVQGLNGLVGKGLDGALRALQPLFERIDRSRPDSPERAAVLAALNGVMGDQLRASGNPLALEMTLRCQGQVLTMENLPAVLAAGPVTAKPLLFIHGLCMNELQWGEQHAQALAALGYTPIYLRYNTGLHTSQNGRELAALLDRLLRAWPQPLQALDCVVHSMGGLVLRSALQIAQASGLPWAALVQRIAFLGTPHHGAPLERAGNWVDVLLGSTPWSRPLARLGQLRSAGITDLRYGHVQDADWQGRDRFRRQPDRRQHLPLPAGIACYTIAATLAPQRGLLADRLLGDGLVPLRSALGQHDEAARCLDFAPTRQLILYRMGHMQLLNAPAVTGQLRAWFSS
ncbi:esterase/lipase family protein [Paucibacter soli]|uniref:esterase/lipase family protein n=1 Tax=Paucibacter soli TaxID=3133433 RepID=UPI0030A09A06